MYGSVRQWIGFSLQNGLSLGRLRQTPFRVSYMDLFVMGNNWLPPSLNLNSVFSKLILCGWVLLLHSRSYLMLWLFVWLVYCTVHLGGASLSMLNTLGRHYTQQFNVAQMYNIVWYVNILSSFLLLYKCFVGAWCSCWWNCVHSILSPLQDVHSETYKEAVDCHARPSRLPLH